MSVEVKSLSKSYGSQVAVNNISFKSKKGEILGFLGPNGAGKSTTMKMITGYLLPSEGEVNVCGYDVITNKLKASRSIGYLAEHNPLYADMFVHEFLLFASRIQGVQKANRKERVKEMVTLCGLTKEQHKKIGTLSKGYQQRVGLAQALIHDPEVLILDEPTSGLDPNQLSEVRQLIKALSKDKTVILSTHIMQEVKALCDHVMIIKDGEIVANAPLKELLKSEIHLKIEFQKPPDIGKLKHLSEVEILNETTFILKNAEGRDLRAEIFDLAKTENWVILSMVQEEMDLEEIFSTLTQGA